LIVGRKEEENQKIQTFAGEEDLLFKVARWPGPVSLLRGEHAAEEIERAAAITARYGKAKDLERVEVTCWKGSEETGRSVTVAPSSEAEYQKWLIHE